MVQLNENMSDPFEIVVGTYEQYLLGYKVENIVNEYKLEKTFATHSHLASVRSVASNKHYLASAGADDSVYLYDMRSRVESGRLMHHNDTVNCVEFTPEASHLFTCSNDGTIAAIRCGNWQIEKHWQKAHKGLAVNTLAIHPTGKIALSTGADGILRTWNLVKGRQAYATNLAPRLKLDAKNVTVLKWSPNGEKYLLAVNQRIDVYSVELAGVDNEIKFDSKIVCVEFLRDDLIAVGLENGQIKFYDLEKSVHTVEAIAHDIRVKCIAFKDDLLVTASSSGEIKLWKYTRHKLDMLQTITCGVRITCLSLAMPCNNLMKKKKDEDEEKEEGEQQMKARSKFRLRQEVVIEDEGDWDVDLIAPLEKKKSKTKPGKKRDLEEVNDTEVSTLKKQRHGLNQTSKSKKKREWIEEDVKVNEKNDLPKKKKKVLQAEHQTDVSSKKRKEIEEPVLDKTNATKKVKVSDENCTTKRKQKSTKGKTDSLPGKACNNIPSKKKRKKLVQEEGADLKKKKKKHQKDDKRSVQVT